MPASHPRLTGRGVAAVCVVLIAASATPVQAQTTYTWIPGSTFWQNAGSWSPGGGPPDSLDIAEFSTGTTGTDVIKWNSATGDLEVDQLHFLKGDYAIDNQDPAQYELVVRSSVADAFRVTDTAPTFSLKGLQLKVTNSNGLIGDGATFNVNAGSGGVPSQVTIASFLQNDGALNILGGSSVSNDVGYVGLNAGSMGEATVTGGGSAWNNSSTLWVGYSSTGTLNVTGGGVVSNTDGVIGGFFGATGTATVTAGSEWNNSSALYVGGSLGSTGGTGMLNVAGGGVVSNTTGNLGFENGNLGEATVTGDGSEWNNSSALFVGRSGTGILTVAGGGVVNNSVGILGSLSGSTGTATVTGGGSEWNNSGDLYVGGSLPGSGGTGTVNIETDGLVSVGGTTKLWSTGTLKLDGGNLTTHSFDNTPAGTLNFYDGTLHVTGAGGTFDPGSGDFAVDGNASSDLPILKISDQAAAALGSQLRIGEFNQGSLVIESGGVVSNTIGIIGYFAGSTGVATVTGSSSQWNNSSSLLVGNGNLGIGTLNVEDGGVVSNTIGSVGGLTGSTGTATVTGGGSEWNNSSSLSVGNEGIGTLNVEAGGVVSNSFGGFLGRNAGSTGTATVAGSGSQWNNSSGLNVGGDFTSAGGTGSLTIMDDGLVDVAGTLKIWDQGTVTIDGGHVVTDTFFNSAGGSLDWLAGSLTINSGVEVGSGTAFPFNLTLSTHQTLITPATTTIAANRTLVLDGGQLTTNNLEVDGELQFDRGTLELTGGSVTGLTQLNIPTNGTLRATGVYNLPFSAASGSQIVATGNLTLGDASQTAGFYSNGNVSVADHTLTIDDANDAVFDSGANATLGAGSSPGTIAAVGGLTLDFGGNITGHGTVDTPDSAATPLVNNGHIAGNSGTEPITLTGYVKGVGTLDNVLITGTDAPGFSPATVVRGSVAYEGTLEIEIGGTSAGDFDRIHHILGDGIAELGGVLDVQLTGGFLPALGDAFEILAAGDVNGTFASTLLPDLGPLLSMDVLYDANTITLAVVPALAGDYNADGSVDAADYVVWRKNDGSQDGYDTWSTHFGDTAGSGSAPIRGSPSANAIPEPNTLLLALLYLFGVLHFRRAKPVRPRFSRSHGCGQRIVRERRWNI